jgi:hypothetical protein
MKKIIILLILLIATHSSFGADSPTYIRIEYGVGEFKNIKYDSLNSKPTGSTVCGSIGSKMSYVELGLFFRKNSFEKDINHDGAANKIIHDGKTFGADMNIFLNNHLSLKLGYAFNTYKEKLGTSVSLQTLSAIKTIYDLEESHNTSNIFYGASFDIFGAKKFDVYASILHFPMGNGKSATTAQAGIKIYMDFNFSDFFGVN